MINNRVNSFTYNGKDSREFNLSIRDHPDIYGAAEAAVESVKIPGRNGVLILDSKELSNITVSYSCNVVKHPQIKLRDIAKKIKAWLLYDISYQRLEDSYDPDYYRVGYINSKLDIDKEISEFGFAKISFSCKPMRYSRVGERQITIAGTTELINPEGFDSSPYMKVYGKGIFSLHINNKTYQFKDITDYIEIDSDMQNAYRGMELMNSKMLSNDFPVFRPGINKISWTGGITKIEIIPRWCCL